MKPSELCRYQPAGCHWLLELRKPLRHQSCNLYQKACVAPHWSPTFHRQLIAGKGLNQDVNYTVILKRKCFFLTACLTETLFSLRINSRAKVTPGESSCNSIDFHALASIYANHEFGLQNGTAMIINQKCADFFT